MHVSVSKRLKHLKLYSTNSPFLLFIFVDEWTEHVEKHRFRESMSKMLCPEKGFREAGG